MEKIKDALAKAKIENVGNKINTRPAQQETVTQQTVKGFPNTENELGQITYLNTPIIKLDNAHLEKNRIVAHTKSDLNSYSFDSLRTQILQKMEENNWRTIAVVSPTPQSGKTLISINLAISIAHQPQKTAILVDLDLRRPKVATYLGIHTEKSMNDYLQDKAPLKDIMINPGIDRLVIVPTMKPVSKSAEILSSKKITGLITELRARYESRIVIFDCPPVLNSDDAMVLLPQVDCILLVIANGMSTQSEIEETLHHLPKANLLGVVLNKAEVESKAYYY
ncbi:CpsD/CapB family tyrosine-protein kinase [Methylotenera versatilis]|uniref:CpsD/CapB family tyrosine-protein kinase n=1 Tax=Methylotenera versatilis TaxID=1055487 RepID=UPI000648FC16|nr:CpsD/CapB family tyrosine-protein kinase [Methylotenera versatilis]